MLLEIFHDICLSLEKYLPRSRDMKGGCGEKKQEVPTETEQLRFQRKQRTSNSKLQKRGRGLRYFRQRKGCEKGRKSKKRKNSENYESRFMKKSEKMFESKVQKVKKNSEKCEPKLRNEKNSRKCSKFRENSEKDKPNLENRKKLLEN